MTTTASSSWRDRAACLGDDHDTFFPHRDDTAGTDAALRVCATCPVATECLTAALAEEGNLAGAYRYGIRGGTTADERARMATPEQRAPVARVRRVP